MTPYKINAPATANTAKIFDSNFEEFYPEINTNTRWVEIEPYIKQAIDDAILPFIGAALYEDLITKYQNAVILTANQSTALRLIQTAAAWYAVGHCLPQKIDIITSAGVQQNVPEHAMPTPQWAFNRKLGETLRTADKKMDNLLAFLEKTTDAYFDLWRNDAAFSRGSTDFFRTTSEFSTYQNILDSRRTFIALAPALRDIGNLKIKKIMGDDMYNEVANQYKMKTLTVANAKLLEKIRLAASKLAVALALRTQPFFIESDGVRSVSNTEGADKGFADRMKQTADAAESLGMEYLTELFNFIVQNADEYPTYKNSTAYTTAPNKKRIISSEDGVGAIMLR